MVDKGKPDQKLEQKLVRLQTKIEQHNKSKETISKGVPLSQQLAPMNFKCVKSITNPDTMFDPKKPDAKTTEPITKVAMNGVAWNPCPNFSSQFVTIDDLSRVTLYSEKDRPIV